MIKALPLLFLAGMSYAETTKVAVIDTGYDFKSTWSDIDLKKANVSIPKICPTGHWDFVLNNDKPQDTHSHGTHIAGVIAKSNQDVDYCLVIYRYYESTKDGLGNLEREIASIKKATEERVNVINISGGGVIRSEEECKAIKQALDQGIQIFVAAGNERSDISKFPYYPAMCDDRVNKIVAVKDMKERKVIDTSNYDSTDKIPNVMKFPGKDIISTLPDNKVGFMTGTSQATGFATGAYIRHYEQTVKPKELLIKSRYFDKYGEATP